MSRFKKTAIFFIVTLVIFIGVKRSSAQQEPMYTQFIDNLLVLNPGFAGSIESGRLIISSRNQWVSVPNAPITRSITYNELINDKVGIGCSILYSKIGPQKQTGVFFDYSYFLRVNRNYRIGLGLKAGLSFYRASLTDLVTIEPDPIYSRDIYKNALPNLGVGFFLFSDDSYVGLSVPKLIENSITREGYTTNYVNKQEIHAYAVAGKDFNFNPDFQMKVDGMIKYVNNAPLSLQISMLAGFRERFWVGGMARIGDSFGIIAQFKPTEKLTIGYSYDITTSELSIFSNGTHEIMLGYDFNFFH